MPLIEVLSQQRHLAQLVSTATPEIAASHPSLKTLGLYSTVQVYVVEVEPQKCAAVIKLLGVCFPLGDEEVPLQHLKRVRRVEVEGGGEEGGGDVNIDIDIDMEGEGGSGQKKKKRKRKPPTKLQILLGPKTSVDNLLSSSSPSSTFTNLKKTINLSQKQTVLVPKNPPRSSIMYTHNNKLWPQVFHHSTSDSQQESSLNISNSAMSKMLKTAESVWGKHSSAIVTREGEILGNSDDEKTLQKGGEINPLQTPILLSIQAVSRRERSNAVRLGVESEEFTEGQYLCTGLDCYCRVEPDFYEAMALLHSRISRIIFKQPNSKSGGLGGCGGLERGIHSLKDTNHHFRVFKWSDE